jgi:hypothetical protein
LSFKCWKINSNHKEDGVELAIMVWYKSILIIKYLNMRRM